MSDDFSPVFWKNLKKLDDDRKTWMERERVNEASIISYEKKSNTDIIRDEFLFNRSLSKRILNWENIRKYSILVVEKR